MAGVVASLWAKLGLDTNEFSKGINRSKKSLTGIRADFSRAQIAATAFAVAGIAYAGKRMFELGASVEETASKFRTVFGPATEEAQKFLDDFGVAAGLSNQQSQELLATTGAIVQGMGLAKDASRKYAEQVVRLAGDLSSFNNIPIEETSHAIQAAITGEREQLKRLGVVILETDVQKRALLNTGKETVGQLTQEEKAMATLQLITERAGVAVGDLARTQDSAANTARRVAARMQNLKELIAREALPAFAQMLSAVDQNSASFNALQRFIGAVFTKLREFIGGIQILGAEMAVLVEHVKVALARLKFWDKEGIQAATDSLNRMREAAAQVKTEIIATADAMVRMTSASGAGGVVGGGGGGAGGGAGFTVPAAPGGGLVNSITQPIISLGTEQVKGRLQDTMETLEGGLHRAQSAAVGFGNAFSTALVDATTRGKDAFTSFANHAIQQLQRIFAQAAVFGLINILLPGSGLFAKTTIGALFNRENALDVSASIPRYIGG